MTDPVQLLFFGTHLSIPACTYTCTKNLFTHHYCWPKLPLHALILAACLHSLGTRTPALVHTLEVVAGGVGRECTVLRTVRASGSTTGPLTLFLCVRTRRTDHVGPRTMLQLDLLEDSVCIYRYHAWHSSRFCLWTSPIKLWCFRLRLFLG